MTKHFIKLVSLFLCLSPMIGLADTTAVLPVPVFNQIQPVFFEKTDSPISQETAWQATKDTPAVAINAPNTANLSAQDLQAVNTAYAEELISVAVIEQKWDILEELLKIYQKMPQFDGVLTEYASGAMDRKQGRQKQAITKYRKILQTHPNLSYVKLDLALMLTENKQLKEARRLLNELAKDKSLSPKVLAVIQAVQNEIASTQKLKPSLTINYESTDNVNNASDVRTIRWLGREWQKDPTSLPQSAHGFRYGIELNKQYNIAGNHYATAELDGTGVHYWDNKDYNEQTIRTKFGYKYWDIQRLFELSPFAEQNWLDDKKYSQYKGISASFGQNITPKTYAQIYSSYGQKDYADPKIAVRHDSHITTLNTTVSHRLNSDTLIYGGIDGTVENTNDKSLASTRLGLRGGVVQSFGDFGVNANVRYAHRKFDAPNEFVYTFIRKDNEYQAGVSFWHKKLVWRGLRPQANVRYLKIDSNMPAFYSKDSVSYFMSVEKDF